MDALKGIVEFWPLLAFFGAMVWWAAGMSKDVHILKKDVHAVKDDVQGLKGDMQALKCDVRQIKLLILKQAGTLLPPVA
ncbi:MAG: hypothetical protein VW830_12685 [Rhodobiaceae bacterium]